MAMARRVAATLRVKYKIDFIFDSVGEAPPVRVKYKIDFIFESEGGRPHLRLEYKIDFIFDSKGAATIPAMAPGRWSLVLSH